MIGAQRSESPVLASPDTLARLVQRYGGPVSTALLDPACSIFTHPTIDGAVGYRVGLGCAVAIGDPVCAPEMQVALAGRFRDHCRSHGWSTVFAACGKRFASLQIPRGYAAIGWGEELILDPREDALHGEHGRDLRKKVRRARKASTTVAEYRRAEARDPALEAALEGVAGAWLEARRGPQIYLASVRLFADPEGKRWFYARVGRRVVGVIVLVRLDACGGYLLDHQLAAPDAPTGTSELLVVEALTRLGKEGVARATFGPAPAGELGHIAGLGRASEWIARHGYRSIGRFFHFESRTNYRRKFRIVATEPSYLLLDPPGVGLRHLAGVLRVFNASYA